MTILVPIKLRRALPLRCDLCGQFKKSSDIVSMGGEYDEWWFECRTCMSDSDFKTYYPNEKRVKSRLTSHNDPTKQIKCT